MNGKLQLRANFCYSKQLHKQASIFFMQSDYFSHNGVLKQIDQAVVPLVDIEYSYGFGVYESMRVTDGTVFFLDEHCNRLIESALAITLEHSFTPAFIEKSIYALVRKLNAQTCNIKVLLIGGRSENQANLYILCLNPYFPDRKLYKTGAHFITYNYQRLYPQAKTLNMLPSYLAYKKATSLGAYDALLVNERGAITEGTRTNFFCVQGESIVSPNEEEILPGVMRRVVLKIAAESRLEIAQRDISFADLPHYDGAFVTSTSSKIMPIKSVNEYMFTKLSPLIIQLIEKLNVFLKDSNGILGM